MTSALRQRHVTLPSGFKAELRGLLWHCAREGIGEGDGVLMVALWACSGDGGWPSVRTIAGLTGTREGIVRHSLENLAREGEVLVTRTDKGAISTAMLTPGVAKASAAK